jgi:hypothetical protein
MAVAQGYEFNEMENTVISGTARYARIWGILSIVAGALVLALGGIVMAVGAGVMSALGDKAGYVLGAIGIVLVPTAFVYFAGGILYLRSGGALRNVVETQGNDIALLMDALRSMRLAFMIEAITTMVALVLGLGINLVNLNMGGH